MRKTILLSSLLILLIPNIFAQDDPTLPVNDFVYQLQNIDLYEISMTTYDLVIIDYSDDGTDETAFTLEEITALKSGQGDPKIVLSYMSIGEAEDYRYYWQEAWDEKPPEWLDAENPNWEGNYKLHYWDPAWQAIIFGSPESYLDKIIAAGFDGVYLDIIDGYNYYEDMGRETAAQEMVDFVMALATYAREQNPDFLIFPQNAAELAADFPEYLETIDGIGQEDIYYGVPEAGERSPDDFIAPLETSLDLFVEAGKTVLLVGYTTDDEQITDHYQRARERGYVSFATVRALDQLTINGDFPPD